MRRIHGFVHELAELHDAVVSDNLNRLNVWKAIGVRNGNVREWKLGDLLNAPGEVLGIERFENREAVDVIRIVGSVPMRAIRLSDVFAV
jgi:hypothetical protein